MTGGILLIVATILATSQPSNPRAKLITVEEAVGQSVVSLKPERVSLTWDPNSLLVRSNPARKPNWVLPASSDPDISYGLSVSRNEFGIEGGVFPSPDGRLLAVYRKDESAVGRFSLYEVEGGTRSIPYPMAGSPSEQISLCVCDTNGNILNTLAVTDFDKERYLTAVSWSPDSKYIFVQVLDRAQHNLLLNMYRASDGSFVRSILSEHNDAWVESCGPIHFVKGSYNFVYTSSSRDSFRNLYLCDTLGRISRLTECAADVQYIANDGKYLYYTSAEISPIEKHLYRLRIPSLRLKLPFNKPQRLTSEPGWHEIDMAPDCSKFIDRYSSLEVPGVTQIKTSSGQFIDKVLSALDPLDEYAKCKVELGSVRSADSRFSNYYRLFYPLDYDPSKSYPLIVYVYGGPLSQMVRNSWLGNIRLWEMLMAQKGYFVYVQDNRGTSNQGAAYEKAINRACGKAESEDQLYGLERLLEKHPEIDRSRIGVHGWSYGGFMALTLSTARPDLFKVCVAGGPVIDWSWYEVMYGERYMDTPRSNPSGYTQSSLLYKVPDLKARTLLIQGGIDDVVVPQHAYSFLQKCIEAEKDIDFFVYPKEEHNMQGRARVHLHEKITEYFQTYL